MNTDNRSFAPQQGGNALVKIVERVAVFGEDDEFLLGRGHQLGWGVGDVGRFGFGQAVGDGSRGEDFAQ